MRRLSFLLLPFLTSVGIGSACATPVATPVCEEGETETADGEPCVQEPTVVDQNDDGVLEPPRLYVDPPFGVGFDCVEVNCEETRSFRIENRGELPLKLTLVRLSPDSSAELTVRLLDVEESEGALPLLVDIEMPSQEAPIELRAGDTLEAQVTYNPVDAEPDEGMLWLDWYDAALELSDAVIKRVELPITTRVLGDAEATLLTPVLNYGYVPLGSTSILTVDVQNTAQGTAVLGLEPQQVPSNYSGAFRLLAEQTVFISPGDIVQLEVAFTPAVQDAFAGTLTIPTNDPLRPALNVTLSGTSIESSFFKVSEPDNWTVAFGDVRVGDERTRDVTIENKGGLPLIVTPSLASGAEAGFAVSVPLDQPLPAIPPLESTTFTVELVPTTGGDLVGRLDLVTNDPTLPSDHLDLTAFGVAPDAGLSTEILDFGQIVQSWTSEPQTLTITNQGTGEMTVELIEFEVGSSSQVHIADYPTLPMKLTGESAIEIAVFVDAQVIGPANAAILIHTDSIENPVRRVEVLAEVVGCDEGCPMEGGTPSCASGSCQIGVCYQGLHDADNSFDNGCECGEDTPTGDVGDGCFDGSNVGPLGDDCSNYQNNTTRSGTLHSETDTDLYYFFGEDGGCIGDTFGDSFGLRAQFIGATPPGIEFCYRHANDGCGGANQKICGGAQRNIKFYDGDAGDDDNRWVTIWVQWRDGFEPMCANYTIRFDADDG